MNSLVREEKKRIWISFKVKIIPKMKMKISIKRLKMIVISAMKKMKIKEVNIKTKEEDRTSIVELVVAKIKLETS